MMKTVNTSELIGAALDWAVAKAIGEYKPVPVPSYSTDWTQGGPAYPAKASTGVFLGMTLRDHFAGLAMQGLLSDPNIQASPLDFAIRAYAMADAMIEYRIKEQ